MGDDGCALGGICGGEGFPGGAGLEGETMESAGSEVSGVGMALAFVTAADVEGAVMGDRAEAGDGLREIGRMREGLSR
jgi:hypothetical protein